MKATTPRPPSLSNEIEPELEGRERIKRLHALNEKLLDIWKDKEQEWVDMRMHEAMEGQNVKYGIDKQEGKPVQGLEFPPADLSRQRRLQAWEKYKASLARQGRGTEGKGPEENIDERTRVGQEMKVDGSAELGGRIQGMRIRLQSAPPEPVEQLESMK
jgi:hypothetical protein